MKFYSKSYILSWQAKKLIQLTDILGVVTASDSECEMLSSGEELDDDDELWELDEIEGTGIDGDNDDDTVVMVMIAVVMKVMAVVMIIVVTTVIMMVAMLVIMMLVVTLVIMMVTIIVAMMYLWPIL